MSTKSAQQKQNQQQKKKKAITKKNKIATKKETKVSATSTHIRWHAYLLRVICMSLGFGGKHYSNGH